METTRKRKRRTTTKKDDCSYKPLQQGLSPVLGANPHTLILGSFPGPVSREKSEYYASPQNIFWDIAGSALGFNKKETSYETRKRKLTAAGYALWNVFSEASMTGSTLSSIHGHIYADVKQIINALPSLKKIVFNGKKAAEEFLKFYRKWLTSNPRKFKFANSYAQDIFKKFVKPDYSLDLGRVISVYVLESTAGTNSKPSSIKFAQWKPECFTNNNNNDDNDDSDDDDDDDILFGFYGDDDDSDIDSDTQRDAYYDELARIEAQNNNNNTNNEANKKLKCDPKEYILIE